MPYIVDKGVRFLKKPELEWLLPNEPLDVEKINNIGLAIGVKFPRSYINCASQYHGGSPNLNLFDFKGHEEVIFGSLLSFNEEDTNNIVSVYNDIKQVLPRGTVPFAADPFGNYICFTYQDKVEEPVITFWDHEAALMTPDRSISYVCKDFDSFLELLYT